MTSNAWTSATGVYTNQKFAIWFDNPFIASYIVLNNLESSGTTTNAGIQSFCVYGSNNNIAFTNVVGFGDESYLIYLGAFTARQHIDADIIDPQVFTLSNTNLYQCYVLKITNNWGNTSYMGFRKIQFFSNAVIFISVPVSLYFIFTNPLSALPTITPPNSTISNSSYVGNYVTFTWASSSVGTTLQFQFSNISGASGTLTSGNITVTAQTTLSSLLPTSCYAGVQVTMTAVFSITLLLLPTITPPSGTIINPAFSGTNTSTITFNWTPSTAGTGTFTFSGVTGNSGTLTSGSITVLSQSILSIVPLSNLSTLSTLNSAFTSLNGVAYFNGSSYITFTTGITVTSWTFECWLKYTSLTNIIAVFGSTVSSDSSSACGGIFFGAASQYGSSIDFGVHSNSSYYVEGDSNWHHIVLINDAINNAEYIYKDGYLCGTLTSASFSSTTFQYIGKTLVSGDVNFTGYMSNLRLWNVAKSYTDIANNYMSVIPTAPNLVCSFPFMGSFTETTSNISLTNTGVTLVTDPSVPLYSSNTAVKTTTSGIYVASFVNSLVSAPASSQITSTNGIIQGIPYMSSIFCMFTAVPAIIGNISFNFSPGSYLGSTTTLSGNPSVNTILLVHFDGSITDSTSFGTTFTTNSAVINTSTYKFGSGSLNCVGTYINTSSNYPLFNFGYTDFTIECWIYPLGFVSSTYNAVFSNYTTWSSGAFHFSISSSSGTSGTGDLGIYGSVLGDNTFTYTFSTNTWYHIAVVRLNGVFMAFVNGVLVVSVSYNVFIALSLGLYIGAKAGVNTFNGYIDELRVSPYAVYTTAFTPPTTALISTSQTLSVTYADYPYGYYPLTETIGTIAYDTSGNGNNGTYTGGYTLGQSGHFGALSPVFNGSSGFVTLPLFTTKINNITMEAWFKTSNYQQAGQMILYNGSENNSNGYGIALNSDSDTSGVLKILYGTVSWISTGVNVTDNNWHYITLVIASTGVPYVYLDGSLIYTGSSSPVPNIPTLYTNIGKDDYGISHPSTARFFYGKIANAGFYTYALSATQVLNHYNNSAIFYNELYPGNPFGFYTLTEATGTSAIDYSGNGNTGTYNGGYTLAQPGLSGSVSPSFNGTSGYVSVPLFTTSVSNISIEAWFKIYNYQLQTQYIIYNGTAASNGFGMYFSTTGYVMSIQLGGSTTFHSTIPLSDSNWHYTALVITSGYCYLYFDNYSPVIINNTPVTPTGNTYIGGLNYLYGQIGYAGLYKTALTSSQIAYHYNNPPLLFYMSVSVSIIGYAYVGLSNTVTSTFSTTQTITPTLGPCYNGTISNISPTGNGTTFTFTWIPSTTTATSFNFTNVTNYSGTITSSNSITPLAATTIISVVPTTVYQSISNTLTVICNNILPSIPSGVSTNNGSASISTFNGDQFVFTWTPTSITTTTLTFTGVTGVGTITYSYTSTNISASPTVSVSGTGYINIPSTITAVFSSSQSTLPVLGSCSNGIVSNISGSGTTYTFTWTPSTSSATSFNFTIILLTSSILSTSTTSVMTSSNSLTPVSPTTLSSVTPTSVMNTPTIMTATFSNNLTSIPTIIPPFSTDTISSPYISGNTVIFTWTPTVYGVEQLQFTNVNGSLAIFTSSNITVSIFITPTIVTNSIATSMTVGFNVSLSALPVITPINGTITNSSYSGAFLFFTWTPASTGTGTFQFTYLSNTYTTSTLTIGTGTLLNSLTPTTVVSNVYQSMTALFSNTVTSATITPPNGTVSGITYNGFYVIFNWITYTGTGTFTFTGVTGASGTLTSSVITITTTYLLIQTPVLWTVPSTISDTYVQASSTYTGFDTINAIQTSTTVTGSWTSNSWCSNSITANQKYVVNFGFPYIANAIILHNAYSTNTTQNTSGINFFNIYGSNNNTSLVNVGTYTDETELVLLGTFQCPMHSTVSEVEPQTFMLNNTLSYQYYILKLANNWGGSLMVFRKIIFTQTLSSIFPISVGTTLYYMFSQPLASLPTITQPNGLISGTTYLGNIVGFTWTPSASGSNLQFQFSSVTGASSTLTSGYLTVNAVTATVSGSAYIGSAASTITVVFSTTQTSAPSLGSCANGTVSGMSSTLGTTFTFSWTPSTITATSFNFTGVTGYSGTLTSSNTLIPLATLTSITSPYEWTASAISGDGLTLAFGVVDTSYVYIYYNGTLQYNTTLSGGAGSSMALSGSGNTIIIGATTVGSVLTGYRSSATWTISTLISSAGNNTGMCVSVSYNGAYMACSGNNQIFIYYNSNSEITAPSWTLQATINGDTNAYLGGLSLNYNGTVCTISGGGNDGTEWGYCDTWIKNNTTWYNASARLGESSVQGKNGYFGSSCCMSGDGMTLVVTQPGATYNSTSGWGAADIYTRTLGSTIWTYQTTVYPTVSGSSYFGMGNYSGISTTNKLPRLCISYNGNVLMIGSYNSEYTYVYIRTGNIWNTPIALYYNESGFGTCTAINASGTLGLISCGTYTGTNYFTLTLNSTLLVSLIPTSCVNGVPISMIATFSNTLSVLPTISGYNGTISGASYSGKIVTFNWTPGIIDIVNFQFSNVTGTNSTLISGNITVISTSTTAIVSGPFTVSIANTMTVVFSNVQTTTPTLGTCANGTVSGINASSYSGTTYTFSWTPSTTTSTYFNFLGVTGYVGTLTSTNYISNTVYASVSGTAIIGFSNTVTITFSTNPSAPALGTCYNGTVSNLSGSGTSYTFTWIPSYLLVTSFNFIDIAGYTGTLVSTNQLISLTQTIVTVSGSLSIYTAGTITVIFSNIQSSTLSIITTTNGTNESLSGLEQRLHLVGHQVLQRLHYFILLELLGIVVR